MGSTSKLSANSLLKTLATAAIYGAGAADAGMTRASMFSSRNLLQGNTPPNTFSPPPVLSSPPPATLLSPPPVVNSPPPVVVSPPPPNVLSPPPVLSSPPPGMPSPPPAGFGPPPPGFSPPPAGFSPPPAGTAPGSAPGLASPPTVSGSIFVTDASAAAAAARDCHQPHNNPNFCDSYNVPYDCTYVYSMVSPTVTLTEACAREYGPNPLDCACPPDRPFIFNDTTARAAAKPICDENLCDSNGVPYHCWNVYGILASDVANGMLAILQQACSTVYGSDPINCPCPENPPATISDQTAQQAASKLCKTTPSACEADGIPTACDTVYDQVAQGVVLPQACATAFGNDPTDCPCPPDRPADFTNSTAPVTAPPVPVQTPAVAPVVVNPPVPMNTPNTPVVTPNTPVNTPSVPVNTPNTPVNTPSVPVNTPSVPVNPTPSVPPVAPGGNTPSISGNNNTLATAPLASIIPAAGTAGANDPFTFGPTLVNNHWGVVMADWSNNGACKSVPLNVTSRLSLLANQNARFAAIQVHVDSEWDNSVAALSKLTLVVNDALFNNFNVLVGPDRVSTQVNETNSTLPGAGITQLLATAFNDTKYSQRVALSLGGLPNNYNGSATSTIVAQYNTLIAQARHAGFQGLITMPLPQNYGRQGLDALQKQVTDKNVRAEVQPYVSIGSDGQPNVTQALSWTAPCKTSDIKCVILEGVLNNATLGVANGLPQIRTVVKDAIAAQIPVLAQTFGGLEIATPDGQIPMLTGNACTNPAQVPTLSSDGASLLNATLYGA